MHDEARKDVPGIASTSENSQTIRFISGSSVKVVTKRAKSTCAWYPGAVSNLTSKGFG
jgi:hypothetical protein